MHARSKEEEDHWEDVDSTVPTHYLTFVGPACMSVGCFVIMVSCVVLFETRDKAIRMKNQLGLSTYPEPDFARLVLQHYMERRDTFSDEMMSEKLREKLAAAQRKRRRQQQRYRHNKGCGGCCSCTGCCCYCSDDGDAITKRSQNSLIACGNSISDTRGSLTTTALQTPDVVVGKLDFPVTATNKTNASAPMPIPTVIVSDCEAVLVVSAPAAVPALVAPRFDILPPIKLERSTSAPSLHDLKLPV